MALLEIYKYPAEVLLKKALPVETIDDDVKQLVKDMGETMFDAPGVGLAAPQVGQPKRIIVYNPNAANPDKKDGEEDGEQEEDKKEEQREFRTLINPEIIASSGCIISENEACLSVPDYSCDVKRFETVTVRGLNIEGKKLEFDAHGLLAVIMQHEIDHLDGILYIDRISVLKRNMYKKKIKKGVIDH
ncbi:MAG: peptide deformylase [Desulfobacterium sp.]|jgi:peptide deformylase|nr:peptide deformylase [Desulfobacterium sp.]